MRELQLDANLSDHQMRKIARFLRKETKCSQIIAPQYEQYLIDGHQLDADLFEDVRFVECIPRAPRPLTVCTDVTALIERVAKRDGRDVRSIHHSVDSGQGFLKFTLSIEYESQSECKLSDMGRRRVLIFAIVPDVKESNDVFRQIYAMVDMPVEKYFHTFHSDLKAVAYATGIDGGSSSHPCFACQVKITVRTTLAQQLKRAKMRTLADNRRHFKRFQAAKASDAKHSASQYFNCTSDPLREFPQNTHIISWCRLPQLHLRLHLNWYIHKMCKIHQETSAWYKHFHQEPSDFHGGDFQGPQLKRLTQEDSIKYLQQLLVDTSAPPDVMLFFVAMVALIKLMKQCFSRQILADGYETALREFRDACLRLPITKVPPKMHIIVAHLDRAIRETGRGLGADSEQQFEAAHHDFNEIWKRYIVGAQSNPKYGINLRRAVLTYNAGHNPPT